MSGSYPVSGSSFTSLRTVRQPTMYAADVFRKALTAHGVQVKGTTERGRTPARAARIASRASMPLSRLMVPFLKLSNNMIAEILVKAIGRKTKGQGSWDAGLPVIERYARTLGVPSARLEMADGSGLSRLDRTTAADVSTALKRVQKARWFQTWYQALPIVRPRPHDRRHADLPDARHTRRRERPREDGHAHRSHRPVRLREGRVRPPAGLLGDPQRLQGRRPQDIEDRIAIRLAGGTPSATLRTTQMGPQLECSWIKNC